MSTRPTKKKPLGSVTWVGAGPGDPGLLTLRGAERLAAADTVVADGPLPLALTARLRADVETLDTSGVTAAESGRLVVTAARAGKVVVRLMPGDPFLGGHGAEEVEACVRAKVPYEVVPGVSALTGVPTYAGVPLTSGKGGQSVTLLAAPDDTSVDWAGLATGRRSLVVPVTAAGVAKLADRLLAAGRPAETLVALTWAGSTPGQLTLVCSLDTVAAEAAGTGRTDVAVAVVGDAVRLRERLSWYETRPLFGWRVLVPRTKEQASALVEQLRRYGAVPVEVPTIAVEPPRTSAPMDRAIKGLVSGRYQWIAFTSTNAVRAVRERFEEVGLDARAFAGVKVAAVGEATAAALVAFGIRPELVPAGEQSSEGLLADWPPYDDILDPLDRVFLPRADIATETLVAGLKERGWAVDDVTAYRTVRAAPPPAETRDAIKSGGFDGVLFTSSSTVRNLVGIAGKPHPSTVIAVIGPQTRKTAEELGLRVDVQASEPAAPALAEALAEFATQRRLAGEQARPSDRPLAKAKKAK